jgi:hypothetical protein
MRACSLPIARVSTIGHRAKLKPKSSASGLSLFWFTSPDHPMARFFLVQPKIQCCYSH